MRQLPRTDGAGTLEMDRFEALCALESRRDRANSLQITQLLSE
jgi:hypothetical protein